MIERRQAARLTMCFSLDDTSGRQAYLLTSWWIKGVDPSIGPCDGPAPER